MCLFLTQTCWQPVRQALGIPFQYMEASDVWDVSRKVILANHPPKHLHECIRSQIEGHRCLLHAGDEGSEACAVREADLAVVGPPCPPFSRMRFKRYRDGSVAQHPQTDVTMVDTRDLLVLGQHKAVIVEQVLGFDDAEATGGSSDYSFMRRPEISSSTY